MKNVYLPTQPVLSYLRAMIDESRLGPGGFKSGIEHVAQQLNRVTGNRYRSDERLLTKILRGEVTQITERTADCLANALKMHPRDIWAGYDEVNLQLVDQYEAAERDRDIFDDDEDDDEYLDAYGA